MPLWRFGRPVYKVHSDFPAIRVKQAMKCYKTSNFKSDDEEEKKFAQLIAQGKTYAIFNVWRPLRTVEYDPLALCSVKSLNGATDSCEVNFGRAGSLKLWKKQNTHEWYYLGKQTPNETLVFIQHVSKTEKASFEVPHVSFAAPGQEAGKHLRKSFEVRIIAVFDSDKNFEEILPNQPA